MERLFDLDMQLVQDSVLLAIYFIEQSSTRYHVHFNPVRQMLADRKLKIQTELDDAAADKTDAAALKAEYEEKLKNVDKEAEAILSEARQKALRNEAKIVEDAKEEAARIIARANEEALLEKKRVVDEMKQEMISVAAAMAAKVITANIDVNIQNQLVDETIKEMGDSTWLS